MSPYRLRVIITIGCVLLAVPARVRADDPLVRLDPELGRFDRKIPSSTTFVLELKAPGKESIRGQVELWPARGAEDCRTAPTSEAQHHTLALMASNTDADRVLRATVPPLQVGTRFCIAVRVIRGLDDVRAIGFAADVTARLFSPDPGVPADHKIDADGTCGLAERRARFAAAIGAASAYVANAGVEHAREALDLSTLALSPAVATGERATDAAPPAGAGRTLWPTVVPAITQSARTASANAIGQTVVDGMDVEGLCHTLNAANGDVDQASRVGAVTATDRSAAAAAPPTLVTTKPVTARLPLFVSGAPPTLSVRRYDDLLAQDAAIPAAAIELEERFPAVAAALHAVENAKPDGREAAFAAYRDLLRRLPPAPVELVYVTGGALSAGSFDELFPSQSPGEPEADWRKRRAQAEATVLANRDLLKRELAALARDDADARDWFDAVDELDHADQAYVAAGAALRATRDAADGARQAIASAIKTRLTAADVRALVTGVNSIQIAPVPLNAPQTDDGASRLSADVGVMVAFPFGFDRAGDHEVTTPWLVPYAGFNLYWERTDRVVPFEDLVRSRRQRLSLTFGALLSRPKVNGAAISTPFRDSGAVVPMAALGYRLTSFTRAAIGGFVFEYQDANPASVAKHRAGAIWLGVSIDADLWSLAAGKALR